MRLNVSFNLNAVVDELRRAQQKARDDRQRLLENVGVMVLAESQKAYSEKSQGRMGGDGIRWEKLSRATIEARVRQRAPARNIVSQRKALAQQIKNLKGVKNAARRKSLILRRQELSKRLQQLVDREMAKHAIGINTGLQRSSAQPGFKASDSMGGNLLEVTASSVTVGYGRNYSKFFDEKRPLLPSTLPAEWQRKADAMVATWADQIYREAVGNPPSGQRPGDSTAGFFP